MLISARSNKSFYKSFLILFSLLVIQLFSISNAQAATPGYTSWNDYVRKYESCDTDPLKKCDNFIEGENVYFIVYTVCTWSGITCTSVTNYTKLSNDPYSLLSLRISSLNAISSVNQGYTISAEPTGITSSGLSYNAYRHTSEGTTFEGTGIIPNINIPLCSGFISGFGCPNDNNSTNPLDRTPLKDGPCDTCSQMGNPFDVRNGSKTETAMDIDFPIALQRVYSSNMKYPGMFGLNWRSNFDKKAFIYKDSNGVMRSLNFITADGQSIVFTSTDGNVFNTYYNDTSQYKVSVGSALIALKRPDSGVEYYDKTTGKITGEVYKGKVLNYSYHTNGLLYRVTDGKGKYLQFYFSGYADVIDQITASNGDILNYTYSGGNVETVTLNNINQITYQYTFISVTGGNTGALLSGKLDGNGVQYAVFTYDSNGRGIENKWITSTGNEVKKYTFSYPNSGKTVVTQGNGFSRTYNMSTINYQSKISTLNWNGYTEQNSFDNDGNVTTKKDFNNVYESYGYDSAGRITSYTKDGKQITINWDTVNNVINSITETSANGTRTTSYTYNASFNVISKIVTGTGDTLTWSYVWANGEIVSETAPDGLVTTYTYNSIDNSNVSGLLASITTNGGQSMVINSYDSRGNPTSITVNGINKTITYDYKGRVLSESTAGITNNYTYDINGNMLTAQMSSGYTLTMTYDTANRLLSIQDNMGGSASFGLDDYTNEVLNTSIAQNNALVRARNKVIDSLGRTTQSWNATIRTKRLTNYYSYIDKPNSTTDSNGSQSNYGWNSRNDMTNYSGGGDSISQSYDIDSNLKSTNINNQQTTMSYDDFGRVVQLASPDTGTHTYVYSTSNRTVSHTDAKGIVHTSTSDLNGNPVTITHTGSSSSQSENYSYNTSGSLMGFSDNSGSTSYVRNGLEQVTSKTQNIGSKSFTVQYGYNAIGQKVSETYPSGMVVTYGYTNGFLTSISSGGTNIISNVAYNSMLKEAISWNLGGNSVSVNKDADGLLTGFVESGVFNQTITTDNEGHILSLSDNVSNNSFNVSLTANYALQSGTINGKSLNYTFGYNNNLYEQQDDSTDYGFNPSPYNSKVGDMTNKSTYVNYYYQYDSNGNTTVDNKGTYTYDLKNNMISSNRTLSGTAYTGTYVFNALGHRVMKTVSGQSRYFVYNENNQLIGEYDNAGNIINEYVYFGLRPVAVKAGSNLNIVHSDYLGTPRVITSGTNGGSVVWQWKNDNPYGSNKAQGTLEFNLRFAGQYYDSESELHYNVYRTYNPEVGRYMQSDPIGLAGGNNTYNYVNRNPFSAIDSDGLFWQYAIPTAAGGIIGGTIGGVMNYNTKVGFWDGFKEGAFTGAITGLSISGAGRLIGLVLGEGAITQVGANIAGSLVGEISRQKVYNSCEEINTNNLLFAGFTGAIFSPISKPYILGKQNVVSWAEEGITPDLNSGRWVMSGFNNMRNFSLSGIFARGYPKNNVIEGRLGANELNYPIGGNAKLWEIGKGLFGQRIIK